MFIVDLQFFISPISLTLCDYILGKPHEQHFVASLFEAFADERREAAFTCELNHVLCSI